MTRDRFKCVLSQAQLRVGDADVCLWLLAEIDSTYRACSRAQGLLPHLPRGERDVGLVIPLHTGTQLAHSPIVLVDPIVASYRTYCLKYTIDLYCGLKFRHAVAS